MSDDPVWRFHQNEIQGLNSVRTFALGICKGGFSRLFEAVTENRPHWGRYPMCEFMKRSGVFWNLPLYLDKVGHLIDRVAIPTEVPGANSEDLSHVPTLEVMRSENSAHRAVSALCYRFEIYFTGRVFNLCPHLGIGFKPIDACEELAEKHWQVICDELRGVTRFSVEDLEIAVERESAAAIEYCRRTILNAPPTSDASGAVTEARKFLTSELLEMTGLGNTALTSYIARTSVPKTGRGKRNRTFTISEAREILNAIVEHSSNQSDKQTAERALKDLAEITT